MTVLILLGVSIALNTVTLLIFWLKTKSLGEGKVELAEKINEVAAASERTAREESRLNREEASKSARELREEVLKQMQGLFDGNRELFKALKDSQNEQLEKFGQTLNLRLSEVARQQKELTENLEKKQEALRERLDTKLKELRDENSKKLDEMRQTVDEKLQSTLEKRLGESFKQVSERLEAVHNGLGEMKDLAGNVGDLKRTLNNVKTRGTWAEVQLGHLLADYLTPDQYEANAQIKKNSAERVEFAIKLPGPGDGAEPVLLALDSKFPIENYDRLVEAAQTGDPEIEEKAKKALLSSIKNFAKTISSKYIDPPRTTDFALMFLPTEGLYAEVLRQPGFAQSLQNEYRIAVAGPSTLAAFLSSLKLGFRTLVVEKRSSEVWQLLGAVKTEFEKFGGVLDKVRKKLHEAGSQLDNVETRSRQINRKLKNVEALPDGVSYGLIENLVEETIEPGD